MISYVECRKRRERQVAHDEPDRHQRKRDDGGPTVIFPTDDLAADQPTVGPRHVGPHQKQHRHQAERVVSRCAEGVSVKQRVQHPQAATTGTVDTEQRLGGTHRKWPAWRRRISHPDGTTHQSGREGHAEWGADLGKHPRLLRVLHFSRYEYEDMLVPSTVK